MIKHGFGGKKSQEYWKKYAGSLAKAKQGGDWGIQNDKQHEKLSQDYTVKTIGVLLAVIHKSKDYCDSSQSCEDIVMHMLDHYKGT